MTSFKQRVEVLNAKVFEDFDSSLPLYDAVFHGK